MRDRATAVEDARGALAPLVDHAYRRPALAREAYAGYLSPAYSDAAIQRFASEFPRGITKRSYFEAAFCLVAATIDKPIDTVERDWYKIDRLDKALVALAQSKYQTLFLRAFHAAHRAGTLRSRRVQVILKNRKHRHTKRTKT